MQSVLAVLMQVVVQKVNVPAILNNRKDVSPADSRGFFAEKYCIKTDTMLYLIANMHYERRGVSLWEEKQFITSTMTKTLVM